MIVVKLSGGLGNQLFQYAVGRALSLARKTELELDLSWYEEPQAGATPRQYELGHLGTLQRFSSPFTRWKFERAGQGLPSRFFLRSYARVQQSGRRFDPRILGVRKKHVYLDGYWQCERYFSEARSALLEEFSVRAAPEGKNAELLAEIAGCNAVALHVRRGDYVNSAAAQQLHGTCSLGYYRAAVSRVLEHTENPRFFVFSDDPDWVSCNLAVAAGLKYVTHNPPSAGHEDLRLMAACKHFITANSSFSWWGAWLGRNPSKLVLAPRRWFADPEADEGDIVPASWQRI
jgi:hypothetical protein